MDIIVQWSQIVMLILMIVGLIYAWIQIRLMQSNETDKKRLAVLSLIQELQYNKKLVTEYIDNDANGSNTTPKDGQITYELNKPRLVAYEQDAIIACGNDEVFLKDITSLYEKFDACDVLVGQVLLIGANNLIECKLSGKMEDFNVIVGKINLRLSMEAKEVNKSIDGVIKKLQFLNENCKEFGKMDKKNIKRIIAREGLIIVVILSVSLLMLILGNVLQKPTMGESGLKLYPIYFELYQGIARLGLVSLYTTYPGYLLIRFIIWAVRTLREK